MYAAKLRVISIMALFTVGTSSSAETIAEPDSPFPAECRSWYCTDPEMVRAAKACQADENCIHPGIALKKAQAKLEPSKLGFFEPSSPIVPAKVKLASRSVFQIAAPAGERKSVGEIFGGFLTKARNIEQIMEQLLTAESSNPAARPDIEVYLYQLRICAKSPQPMDCKMFEGDTLSSGYLVGDGSRVRTAYHAVGSMIDHAKPGIGGVATQAVPIFVFDGSGKIVWGPASGIATAQFPSTNSSNIGDAGGSMTKPNDDLVEIQVGKKLGIPLHVAATSPPPGTPIYLVGYPKATTDRAAFGVPDSPGGQLRIARGQVIPMDVASLKQGVMPEDLLESTKRFYGQTIVTNGDGAPGLSGGAAVTESGEVVGTYTAGSPADGTATPNKVAFISKDSLLGAPFKN